jgi:hypothetical protein
MPGLVNAQGDALANDDARPQTPAAPLPDNAPTQGQQPAAPPTIREDDPDLVELRAAEAALQGKQREEPADPGQQQPAQQQPPARPAPAAAPAQQQQQQPGPVPYDRFAAVSRDAATLRDRVTYLEGAIAALRQGSTAAPAAAQQPPQGAPQAQPPADPIDAQVATLRKHVTDAARRHDIGEITLVEFEEQRGAAEDRIAALRAEQLRANMPTQQGLMDQLAEQAHLNQLVARHPYAKGLSTQQAEALAVLATQELAMEGNPIRDSSLAESLRLRERVAQLSDTWGPKWGVQPSSSPQQQPSTPSTGRVPAAPSALPLSPAAAARDRKMQVAAALPPDPASMGMGAPAEISAAQIEVMSDEEIAALPPAVLRRVAPSMT